MRPADLEIGREYAVKVPVYSRRPVRAVYLGRGDRLRNPATRSYEVMTYAECGQPPPSRLPRKSLVFQVGREYAVKVEAPGRRRTSSLYVGRREGSWDGATRSYGTPFEGHLRFVVRGREVLGLSLSMEELQARMRAEHAEHAKGEQRRQDRERQHAERRALYGPVDV